MNSLSPQQVKARIPHTWPLFFARHGRFTPVQQQAIPPILDGRDTLVIAATAAGKTEAVIAPLLERLWSQLRLQAAPLTILYICPTRALVGDLYRRLQYALAESGIRLGLKTGDVQPGATLPAILITTPESTDSLLTRSPQSFAGVQAIVLDEIHLFDNTPRGDHVRCLLARLERIRQYAQPGTEPAQRVALSATVSDPAGVARRYLRAGQIVAVPGGREILAEIAPLYNLGELVKLLSQRPSHKALIFCNSRDEVEQTAVTLRQQLPHHADIFVHYSNLDATLRRETEERFAQAAVAICVATSTLELGIDIGSVDEIVLLGAPPDLNAFTQRIGRGGRRAAQTPVLCMPKSPGEWARFEALLTLADNQPTSPAAPQWSAYGFRPSVLVQQIFSLLKQSPTGAVRLADVGRIAPPDVTSDEVRKIVSHLAFTGYLQPGRPGEWKPDEKLNVLLDQHEIYSNIGGSVGSVTAVDAHSGRTLAYAEQTYPPGTILLFGGRSMRVVWVERYRFGLTAVPNQPPDAILRQQKSFTAIPFAVTQAVAQSLGLAAGEIALLPQEPGLFLFHFWGTVWGKLLAAVLQENGFSAVAGNEYALYLQRPLAQLPPCEAALFTKAARQMTQTLTNRLEMGRFHALLPADVATTAVIKQLNLAALRQLYASACLVHHPHLAEALSALI